MVENSKWGTSKKKSEHMQIYPKTTSRGGVECTELATTNYQLNTGSTETDSYTEEIVKRLLVAEEAQGRLVEIFCSPYSGVWCAIASPAASP